MTVPIIPSRATLGRSLAVRIARARLIALPVASCLMWATAAVGAELTVTPSWPTDGWVSGGEPIELRLSRPLAPDDGSLAVLVDALDVSALVTVRDTVVEYGRGAVPIRPGQHEVVVWSIGNDGAWSELGRFPLRVRTRAGFETAEATPAVDLTNKGQVGQGYAPVGSAPDPATYQEATVQAGLRTSHSRGDLALRSALNVVGTTIRQEALRFAQEGDDAPEVDLSSYLLELEKGPLRLAYGHVAFGANRLLAASFAARGGSLSVRLGKALNLEAAATSGSAIVGWGNTSGLSDSDHQVRWVTLGAEAAPAHPGTLRLELSYLDGSLRPATSFNQGAVTSAESSTGNAVRLLAADHSRRFQLEAGFARSTFRPADDPELEGGLTVTPISESTRDARYADLTIALVRGARLSDNAQANLSLALHHQRVEPLYRSVATALPADLETNSADLTANLGAIALQVSYLEGEDNLARVATILTTATRRATANLAAPLRDVFSGSAWLPTVTLTVDRTQQVGTAPAVGGAFEPSQVPDQVGLNRAATVEWAGSRLRAGYRWTNMTLDNRQPGLEATGSEARTDAVSVTATVSARLELGLDGTLEAQESRALARTDRTRRLGVHGAWQVNAWMTFTGALAKTRRSDSQEQGESDELDADGQVAVALPLNWLGLKKGRGSVFARYANRRQQTLDRVLAIDEDRRAWTVNTGINLSLF